MLTRPEASFELARQVQIGAASLGDVFAFCSGLYFRGKLAYARHFAEPPVEIQMQHYAFLVDDELFDRAYARLVERGIEDWADAQMRRRGENLAMIVADQRMPGMEGTELLVKARQIYPEAKRVLLTAYADTQAAIAAINEVSLDYYLLKPWDPPEEQLYPVVADLLATWEAGAALEAGGVRVIGHRFSKDTHDLRDFLARNRIPGRWLDVERDSEARELLKVAAVAEDRLPVVVLEDGDVLERPLQALRLHPIRVLRQLLLELIAVSAMADSSGTLSSA